MKAAEPEVPTRSGFTMCPTSHAAARRALPWGLIGMLGLVLTVELLLVHGNPEFTGNHALCWRMKGLQVERVARARQVLCFGDSLVNFGVAPRVIETRIGLATFNLAVHGGAAPSSYFLFRRALVSGARPSAVIVDFSREILAKGPGTTQGPYPWADLLAMRETVELSGTARDPDLFAGIVLNQALPSFRGRFEIRGFVTAKFKDPPTGQELATQVYLRNWVVNLGAQMIPKALSPIPDPWPAPGSAPRAGQWRCDPVNAVYVERFLDLTARHGVLVYWLLPPVAPGTQACWELSGDESLWISFIQSAQARHPDLIVIDGRHSDYDRSVFIDEVHLDRDGAAGLSIGLADVLTRPELTSLTRWVKLPNYLPAPGYVPIEDLSQSHIGLNADRWGRRR